MHSNHPEPDPHPKRSLLRDLSLAAAFLLPPLVFHLRSAEGFTLPKEITAGAALVFFLAAVVPNSWRRITSSGVFLAAAAFTAWMLCASFATAIAPGEVLPGSIHWLLFAGATAAGCAATGRERSKAWVFAAAASVPVALLALAQAGGFDAGIKWTASFEDRVFSTFGNPNFLAGYFCAILPPAAAAWLTTERPRLRFWTGAWFILLTAAFSLTRVRGAFPALLAGWAAVGIVLALSKQGREVLKRRKGVWIACFVAALLSLAILIGRQGGFSTFSLKGDTARYRLETWRVTSLMVKDHPWVGVGSGNFKVRYPAYQWRGTDHLAPYTLTEHVHNEPLQVLAEGGLVGFALFLVLVGCSFWTIGRALRSGRVSPFEAAASLGGWTSLLVFSLSNFPLQLAPMAILAGWMISTGRKEFPAPEGREGETRFLPWIAAGVTLVVLGRVWASSVAYRNTIGETALGNADKAVRYGIHLVALEPSRYRSWFAASEAWSKMGMEKAYDNALDGYGEALRRNPVHPESLLGRAGVYVVLGRYKEAEEDASRGVSIAPNLASLQFVRGAALFHLGRHAEAEEAFVKTVSLQSDHFDAWVNLGVARVLQGKKREAAEAWIRAAGLKPGNPQVAQYLRSVGVIMR